MTSPRPSPLWWRGRYGRSTYTVRIYIPCDGYIPYGYVSTYAPHRDGGTPRASRLVYREKEKTKYILSMYLVFWYILIL
jgi:hypothetical protein